jgi:hypothetical protein
MTRSIASSPGFGVRVEDDLGSRSSFDSIECALHEKPQNKRAESECKSSLKTQEPNLSKQKSRISLAVEVVKEDAPQSAGLAAVLNAEVLISPLLELGVVLRVMLVAHLLVRAVEVLHVILL